MNKINVLWFTNTISGAGDYLGFKTVIGGWIESLEKNIKKIEQINLGIAFYWGNAKGIKIINGERATYFIIPDQRSRIKKRIDKYNHNVNIPNEIKNYLEIIKEFKPDIINVFGTEKSFGIISKHTTIPIVIHLQGILMFCFYKWFPTGMDQLKILRLSSLKKLFKGSGLFHDYYYYKNSAKREINIFKSCKYFMGRTSWDRRIVYALNPEAQYYHIDEILREEFYERKWTATKKDKFKIISTIPGNIFKGLGTVLEGASILSENYEFIWNIAGIEKTEEIINVFEKKHKKRFEDYNICFLGKLTAGKLIEEMLSSDLFVHPSHIDNSPNSVCEAMILGMPIISSASGGITSLLKNEEEGILIQDGDPYSLAGAIMEVKKEPETFIHMGEKARARALRRHNQQKIVKDLVNVYNQILKDSGSQKCITLNYS